MMKQHAVCVWLWNSAPEIHNMLNEAHNKNIKT